VRYGNVVGSRGSVIPIFIQQRMKGRLTITDERMTRFWLTLEKGVRFVIRCTEQMHGGEVFVPKIPSTKIIDLAKVIAPQADLNIIGIRPGEKLHEVLINEDEARSTLELDDMFVVQPTASLWFGRDWQDKGRNLPDGFRYTSETNPDWLSVEQIHEIVAPFEQAA
jgi:UDP-N-acetylglucosamine 4,6-dehydratase